MFGSGDSGGMFGASGLFGNSGNAGSTSKEFGSSTATSAIGGDTYGLQFDQQTMIVLAVTVAGVVLAGITLILMLRGK